MDVHLQVHLQSIHMLRIFGAFAMTNLKHFSAGRVFEMPWSTQVWMQGKLKGWVLISSRHRSYIIDFTPELSLYS